MFIDVKISEYIIAFVCITTHYIQTNKLLAIIVYYRYIAVMPGVLPRRNQLFHFGRGDVVEKFRTLSFFRGLTYKVKGRTMLLIPGRFRKSVDLFDMLHEADSKKYQLDEKQ